MVEKTWEKLQAVLQSLGHEPKKSLGQNFLVSDGVIQKIIHAAESFQAFDIIEIGPGPGALTQYLKDLPANFQVIELDRSFAKYWRDQNLIVHELDALHFNWTHFLSIDSGVRSPRILVSNLPYQISSSLVIDRSIDELPLDGMVLMFQKEVAQRIRAAFDHELYGMLSVISQTFWQISVVSEAGPRDFFPPPRVASRVLKFVPKVVEISDRRKYLKLVKACFLQPRKLLVSNLEQAGIGTKEQAHNWLVELHLNPKSRAEELRIEDYFRLYLSIYHRVYPGSSQKI